MSERIFVNAVFACVRPERIPDRRVQSIALPHFDCSHIHVPFKFNEGEHFAGKFRGVGSLTVKALQIIAHEMFITS